MPIHQPEAPHALERADDYAANTAVNAIRTSFALRIATVTVTIFAWMVLSNHCAIAEMLTAKTAPVPAKEHGCCNHHPAPAKDEKPRSPMQQGCCKSLTVLLHDGVKLPVAASLIVSAMPVGCLVVPAPTLPEEKSAASATGRPPDIPGFVELVLHRSLRSHAPPLAA